MRTLLQYKADPNIADQRGWTPLIISVYQGHERIVNLLLEFGCDIEKKDCVKLT